MIHRRDLLKLAAATPLLSWAASSVSSDAPAQPDAVIVDQRFRDQLPSLPNHWRQYDIHGDVTLVWYEKLDPSWRRPGFELVGITGADALFVLEQLAWDRGRRVVARSTLREATPYLPALVQWTIAPVHPSVRSKIT